MAKETKLSIHTDAPEWFYHACECGLPVYMRYNGGELDRTSCNCGRVYELRSPVTEMWMIEK